MSTRASLAFAFALSIACNGENAGPPPALAEPPPPPQAAPPPAAQPAPPPAPPTFPDGSAAVQVSAGQVTACGVDAAGAVRCWGGNGAAELGDGSRHPRPGVVTVKGIGPATAVSVAPGPRHVHVCARLRDGRAACWGSNSRGQLGAGVAGGRAGVSMVPGLTGVAAIRAGHELTCAVLGNGEVRCFGRNDRGQAGDGTTKDRPYPVPVTGVADAIDVELAETGACALLRGGGKRCWGDLPRVSSR